MTWIKLRNTFAEDDRWLDAGHLALAVHIAALCYSDQQLTDGVIGAARVRRVALTLGVAPDDAEVAASKLVHAGFWAATDDGYQIVDYLADQISREDAERTRDRWAADKRRQRQHNAGDHALCDPEKCRGARTAASGSPTSKGELTSTADKTKVRRGQRKSPARTTAVSRPLDPTRPDPTQREGREGRGKGGSAKGAPPPRSARRHTPAAPPADADRPTTESAPQFADLKPSGPPCPHGTPGGLMNRADGMFVCDQCQSVAPRPHDPKVYQLGMRPGVRAYLEQQPIRCSDPHLTLVAQAIAEQVCKRSHTNTSVPTLRLFQAYVVERLEPGRVAEVLANGTTGRGWDT
ncbi:hypothetical protein DJ010_20365 [Nocardioides silvaticus]|uniref:Uncharacterized protein n=1 Tax=Nocardioides silvaticus TaxID=2201891 RepID=A0A316TB62_9ACTN|nr:hypothetical protein [Nocardioides silvaticus]PWN00978.1 hypothetical protein DJ010_20365 [Nocardioides silvaticus]